MFDDLFKTIYICLAVITLILLCVLAAVLCYKKWRTDGMSFRHGVTQYGLSKQIHGVVFGKRFGDLLCYSPEQNEGHIAVFGPSGKGKTSSLLIPTLRHWEGTALVIDVSGDIGANVNMKNKIEFEPSKKNTPPYNVFASIDAEPRESDQYELLEQLAFLLLPDVPTESGASAFFTHEGRNILTAAFICYYTEGWDFVQICEFVLSHDWRSLLNDIASHDNAVANMNISSFAGNNEQNNAGCKQAADAAIKLFATNERVKNALRTPVAFEQAISPAVLETNSLFIKIDDAKLNVYAPLLKIITAQSLEYFSKRPAENKSAILFCLDEFASLGKLNITDALRKLRKRHIRIMMLTQAMADLDLIYGKTERQAMMNNFAFKVILGCGDTETQEYFSKLIGDKKGLLIDNDTVKKAEPIIKPADLAQLGESVIILSDDGYTKLQKNYYFK